MFIYKITVNPTNKIYIGLDTHEEYKRKRWNRHCWNVKKFSKIAKKSKLMVEMHTHGIDACSYEVLATGFTSIYELALTEMRFIKQFDSYKNGLNGSVGGDGLNRHALYELSNEEYLAIKEELKDNFSAYNNQVKWINTTIEDRKHLTSHLLNPEYIKRRTETLKAYYATHPEVIEAKRKRMITFRNENKEYRDEQSRKFGLLGAAKTSKQIKVEHPDGHISVYESKNKFYKETGYSSQTVIQRTKMNQNWNGFKAWEL